MKAKKVTKANKVIELYNSGVKPKDISTQTKSALTYVYNIIARYKKGGDYVKEKSVKATKPVAKKRGRPAKNQYEYVNGAQVLKSDDTKALQAEVKKLNEWCLEWRSKYDQLQDDLRLVQAMYAESRAVIRYLESKVK